MASFTQTITVNDTVPPTVVCPANITVGASDGNCLSTVVFAATATDNCGSVVVACVPASGSPFGLGSTMVNCSATDSCGNVGNCSFTVTVEARADLSISIVPMPNPVTVGNPLAYVITVNNNGPCTATGVSISDVLSPGQLLLAITNGMGAPGMACPVNGPAAWWPAESTFNDIAGANHGTQHGGVGFVAGEVGQSFSFDGVNDYISVSDAPALRPSSLTIEGWIKIQDPNGVHVLVSKPQGPGSSDSYSVWISSGVLYAAISDASGSGSFLSYPEFPASSLFTFSDIINLPSLAAKLKNPAPADGVSQYLVTQFSPATLALLAAYVGGPDADLQRRLAAEFNHVIQNGPLYDGPRFAGVTLAPETQYILGRNPMGSDLVRLNRFLIRDTYPTDIVMNLFPQLDQRFHIAYSFDQSTHVQALYVNGALVDVSFENKTIAYDSHDLFIGAGNDSGAPGFFYQGQIDELSLYPKALGGSEIRTIYEVGAGGKCQSPGPFVLGSIASGQSHKFTVLVSPTNCGNVSVTATVSATTVDPNLVNNTATGMAVVDELPANELILTIKRVSLNNDLLEICWPVTCSAYDLQATGDLFAPMPWNNIVLPTQIIGNRVCTVILPTGSMRYFQLKRQ